MLTNIALYLFVYGQVVPWYGQVLFYNQLSVDKYTFMRFRHPWWRGGITCPTSNDRSVFSWELAPTRFWAVEVWAGQQGVGACRQGPTLEVTSRAHTKTANYHLKDKHGAHSYNYILYWPHPHTDQGLPTSGCTGH